MSRNGTLTTCVYLRCGSVLLAIVCGPVLSCFLSCFRRCLSCAQRGAKAYKAVRETLRGQKSKNGVNLHEVAQQEFQRSQRKQRMQLVVLLLNWAAFLGYTWICITYYYEDPALFKSMGDSLGLGWEADDFVWYGNFVGDFAWTVEPVVLLAQSTF
eukprot:scaffold3581_cov252-Pinguiococcus_pyrenoidosus.AAC.24